MPHRKHNWIDGVGALLLATIALVIIGEAVHIRLISIIGIPIIVVSSIGLWTWLNRKKLTRHFRRKKK